MRQVQAVIGAILAALALIGCAVPVDFDGPPFLHSEPSVADLPGVYVPTPATEDRIERGGYARKQARVEIHADGTFHIENIPAWWLRASEKARGEFDSGEGKWQIAEQQKGIWGLDFMFAEPKLPGAHGARAPQKHVSLRGEAPPYQLHLTYGDPDRGEFMLFRKLSAEAPRP
jgi:hypothetical protein